MTGGAVAEAEEVTAAAGEVELGVEGGDAVDLAEGEAEAAGDEGQGFSGQVAVDGLGRLQDRDQRAALALVLVGIDIFLRRWARAAGLAEIIIALLGAGVLVVSAVMFNRVGGLQLFGVSLLDIFTQYLSNTIQVTIEPGLVLVAIGLGLLIVGGGLRLVVTHFER